MSGDAAIRDDDGLINSMLAYMATNSESLPIIRLFLTDDMRPFIRFLNDNSSDMTDLAGMMRQIYRMNKKDQHAVSKDAWSYGQLKSKMWLVETLAGIDLDLGNIWILCGWVGTLPLLMRHSGCRVRFETIRSFDIDSRCAPLAETLNNPLVVDDWRFKATTMDANDMRYDDFRYETLRYDGSTEELRGSADTVINTSCEHLSSTAWWDNIPSGKLVVLQSNDFFDHRDHDKPVVDLSEMRSRYPMQSILFEGKLDCDLYNRFMLIGRK